MLIRFFFCQLVLLFLGFHLVCAYEPNTRITVRGDRFEINGTAVHLYGIRVASASQSDKLTEALVANLDEYNAHGVNAVTVFLQGSSGGFSDPFSEDGNHIDPDHLGRIKHIIEACDQRGMIVIVGIFYQRVMKNLNDTRRIQDTSGVRNAVDTTTRMLRGYSNVIVNIANEQNSAFYKDIEFFDFRNPERIIELCERVRRNDPDRLVGAGGYDDEANIIIGKSPMVDVLLFDTFHQDIINNQDSGWHYDLFVKRGVVDKPIVNVELFGGWTSRCVTESGVGGCFLPEHKRLYFQEIDAARKRPGLSVFFHASSWCQGQTEMQPIRYDLGGYGTAEDVGIRWWFEYVRSTIWDR
ncbi:MAG: hypothetical protein AB3N63_02475 [Puniceicoccaceae bacterium]